MISTPDEDGRRDGRGRVAGATRRGGQRAVEAPRAVVGHRAVDAPAAVAGGAGGLPAEAPGTAIPNTFPSLFDR